MNVVQFDWISELRSSRLFDALTTSWLRSAVEKGGYVSGAGARTIGRWILDRKKLLELNVVSSRRMERLLADDFILNYFAVNGIPNHGNHLWKGMSGDIDVFFRGDLEAQECISEIGGLDTGQESKVFSQPTPGGWGREFCNSHRRMQVITRSTGEPEQVVSTFDIENAGCYLEADSFHFTDRWLRLEEANQLGIQRADRPNLPWRVSKWMWKGHYDTVSPDSQEAYLQCCISVMERIVSRDGMKMWDRDLRPQNLRSKLRDANITKFTHSNLLLASLLMDSYDQLSIIGAAAAAA